MKTLFLILIAFIFISCGGGGSSSDNSSNSSSNTNSTNSTSSNNTTTNSISLSLSGKVVDGYIKNASVCLDLNINGVCDANEPKTTSGDDGSFSFETQSLGLNLIIPIISIGGVDTATNEEYSSELIGSIDTSSTIFSTIYINPFTDLLINAYLNSSTKDSTILNELKNKLSNSFSIESSNITSNPMAQTKLFSRTQEIEHIKDILETTIIKEKNEILNEAQKKELRKNIKLAIINALENTATINWDKIIENIQSYENMTISSTKKNYLKNQFKSNRESFDTISQTQNLISDNFASFQKTLNDEIKQIHEKIKTSNFEVVKLSSLDKLISKTLLNINSLENKEYNTPPKLPDFR